MKFSDIFGIMDP